MITLPMFPLGTVVFPGAQLPLRVFEPRYLNLFGDLSETESYFGTCLIEKGHEVGGDDARFSSGTLCQIIRLEELPSKQLLIQCIGIDRLSVDRWLPDEPYPIANVNKLPNINKLDFYLKDKIVIELERCYVLLVQKGAVQPESLNINILDQIDLYTACSIAPLGQLDKYKLLASASSESCAEILLSLITSERETLAAMSRLQNDNDT